MSCCLRCQKSHRWGRITPMGIYRSLDKMTFAVPSVTLKGHCPGNTGYTQTSKSHCSVKKMFYDCLLSVLT